MQERIQSYQHLARERGETLYQVAPHEDWKSVAALNEVPARFRGRIACEAIRDEWDKADPAHRTFANDGAEYQIAIGPWVDARGYIGMVVLHRKRGSKEYTPVGGDGVMHWNIIDPLVPDAGHPAGQREDWIEAVKRAIHTVAAR